MWRPNWSQQRFRQGATPAGQHTGNIEPSWTQEDDALLGRFTDAEIARRTGRSNSAVWLRRKQLGIPPVPRANYGPWTTAEIALLGTMPDKELAARFGHSVGGTKAKRLTLGLAAFER